MFQQIDAATKKFQQIVIRSPSSRYNVALFKDLPVVILQIIQSYLSAYDYRQLLYTNVSIFQRTKYETVYYDFIGFEKWKDKINPYLGFQDNRETETYFLEEMIAKGVKDKSKQVSLLVNYPTQKIVRAHGHLMSGIHKLTFIDTPQGSFWPGQGINMNHFCHIYHVVFRNLNLMKLEGLQNIHILEIHNARSLSFIATIPSLHRLVLIQCFALADISQFGHVKEIIAKSCRQLRLDGLGTQQKVKLEFLGRPVEYQRLSRVPYLSILTSGINFDFTWQALAEANGLEYLDLNTNGNHTKITTPSSHRYLSLNFANIDISNAIFQRLEVADLTNCFIQDLSCLCNVSQLRLTRCRGTFDFRVLKSLKRLALDEIGQIEDVSMLHTLTELSLCSCEFIQDVSPLGTVKKLSLMRLPRVTSLEGLGKGNVDIQLFGLPITELSPIGSVAKVSLMDMLNLTTVKDLTGVKYLFVSRCPLLEDLSGVGGLQSLVLDHCPLVRSLQGLKTVPNILLQFCNGIEEVIDDLEDQERLVINNCPVAAKIKSDRSGRYDHFVERIPYFRLNTEGLFVSPFLLRKLLPTVFCE